MLFNLDQMACSVQRGRERLACLEAVLPLVFSAYGVDGAVGVEHVDDLEVVFLPQIVVVWIVSGGHLEASSSKLAVHVVVLDDGDAAPCNGHDRAFSVEVCIPLILGMDANGGVGQDGFWTGGRDGEPFVAAFDLVFHVVQFGLLFGMDDLLIAHGCEGFRVPVDHAQTSVHMALGMQIQEGVNDTFAVVIVEGEVGALPIAAGAQFAELL